VWPQDEDGGIVSFSKDGQSLYVTSSLGQDTTEMQLVDATNATASAFVVNKA